MKSKRILFLLGSGVVAAGLVTAIAVSARPGAEGAASPAARESAALPPPANDPLTRVLAAGTDTSAKPGSSEAKTTTGAPIPAATPAAQSPRPPATGSSSTSNSSSSGGSNSTFTDPGAGGTGGGVPQGAGLDRKIVFNASIGLQVKDIPAAFGAASRVARENGGFVERSTFANSTDGKEQRGSASLTIRVPADKYQDALQSLRTLEGAKVASEGSKSTEVTEQYTDLQSRQRNLERTEGQYLRLLEQAKTIQEILTVNDRLDSVRNQIEQIKGRLNVLDRLTELAAIDVSLAPVVVAKADRPADDGGPRGFNAAFADAWESSLEGLRYAGSAAGVAAVALIWLAIPLGLVYAGARVVRRRHQGAPVAP